MWPRTANFMGILGYTTPLLNTFGGALNLTIDIRFVIYTALLHLPSKWMYNFLCIRCLYASLKLLTLLWTQNQKHISLSCIIQFYYFGAEVYNPDQAHEYDSAQLFTAGCFTITAGQI